MPRSDFVLDYEATHFGHPPPFPLVSSLDVSWTELVGAVVTVGRWPPHMFAHGAFSDAEVCHRAFCLLAYFQTVDGRLTHSPAHESLDPSERGIASYYLGMAAAKIFAARCLGVPWLMHLSRYGAAWSVTYTTDARPDLFGFDSAGRWTVAEAKGRARLRAALIDQMQDQKSAVGSINGVVPRFRIGTATRFRRGKAQLRVVDPPAKEVADDVHIDTGRWLSSYYQPVVALMDEEPEAGDDGFVYGPVPGVDVQVGLHQRVLELVRRQPPVETPTTRPTRSRQPKRRHRPVATQTADGLTEWTQDLIAALAASPGPRQPDGLRVKLGESWALG